MTSQGSNLSSSNRRNLVKSKWKITTAILVIALISVCFIVLFHPSTSASANPNFLNVNVEGPTKLGVNQTGIYTASVNNSYSGKLSYFWAITPADNKTVLTDSDSKCNLSFLEATTDRYLLTVQVEDIVAGNLGYGSLAVYDPYTNPIQYLGSVGLPYTYLVQTDGSGWYRGVKGVDNAAAFPGTDAGVVIEAALNATGLAGGGIVHVTPGNYPVNAMHLGSDGYYQGILMAAPNLILEGEGASTILQLAVANSRIITLNYQCVRCEVRSLTVNGQSLNTPGSTSDALIVATSNYDSKVTNVFAENGGSSDGMGAFDSGRAIFTHNLVTNSTHGIALQNSSRCIIDDCQVTNVTGTGYLIAEASYDNTISNSVAYATGQFAFEISLYGGHSPARNTISGCTGEISTWSCLSIFGAIQNTVTASHFSLSVQNGISISGNATAGSANNIITGCFGISNGGCGLLEDTFGSSNIISSSNFILNTGVNITTSSANVSHSYNGTGLIT